MPKQRTGSVTYSKQRKAWVARLDWVDESGKRQCRKKQVENKTAGKVLVKHWIRDIARHGTTAMEGDRMTFEKLARIYEDRHLQPPVYRGDRKISGLRSWKTLRGYLKVLVAHFGRQSIRSVGYHNLEKYKQRRMAMPTRRDAERSLANVHRELALLRQVFTLAEREGWVPVSPFKRGSPIINLADETRRERILTREEEARLLAACTGKRTHLRGILIIALDCGLRRGEILSLSWRDVDIDGGFVTLRSANTKTAKSRTVGLTARVQAELRRLWEVSPDDGDGSVFGITDFQHALASALRDAGVEDFKFHDARHSCVTRWVQGGLAVGEAMRLAGHTTLHMHARYTNIDSETARRGAAALDAFHKADEQPELIN